MGCASSADCDYCAFVLTKKLFVSLAVASPQTIRFRQLQQQQKPIVMVIVMGIVIVIFVAANAMFVISTIH